MTTNRYHAFEASFLTPGCVSMKHYCCADHAERSSIVSLNTSQYPRYTAALLLLQPDLDRFLTPRPSLPIAETRESM